MNLLILGGISARNQAWVHEVDAALAPLVGRTLVHQYAHWSQPEGSAAIDIDKELAAVAEKVKDFGDYIVFAKSAGSVLTLKGIASGVLAPKACVFAGLPLGLIKKEKFDLPAWIAANTAPVALVQNSDDPVGSFADVKQYLADTNADWQLTELPGDTHSYEDLRSIKSLTETMLQRTAA